MLNYGLLCYILQTHLYCKFAKNRIIFRNENFLEGVMDMSFKKLIILFLIIIGASVINIYFEVNYVKLKNIFLKSKKLPKDQKVKILHISDLHNKKLPNNNKSLLNRIEKLNPDIIALTGDIIDSKSSSFGHTYNLLEELVKINKHTYFVSGNHEWKNIRKQNFITELKKRKVKIINNTNKIITMKNFSINICGIDDPYSNHENVGKAFDKICADNFTLLLSHSPDIVLRNDNLPCDLMICGHTHGGQIRFPFIGGIIAPGQGFFPKYDKGIYKLERNRILYINSGLGTSTLPIRFLNRSQISLITLLGD